MSTGDPAELAALVRRARAKHLTVRAVGSGHSWSDAPLTTGYLVLPINMTGAALPGRELLRDDHSAGLVEVRSGTTLRQLNAFLDRHRLGLVQMGGYDGQTIAGAVATSTHGSGIAFPPLPDYVRSIDLIDGTGTMRRIEPAGGVTDPAKFAAARSGWKLCQDDELFNAVVCGIGCMGIVLSLVVEVRDEFRLTEKRRLLAWDEVRAELEAGVFRKYPHYEFYLNPYSRKGPGKNRCIVTTRIEESDDRGPHHRPRVPELLGHLPWITAGLMQLVGAVAPRMFPLMLDLSLGAIAWPRYRNVSYKVFNIGSVNNLRAYSGEMAVPAERAVDAVELVLAVADEYRREGSIYHTSPVAMRFVSASRALTSMMHDRETMTLELIQLVDTIGGTEIIAAHEERLADLEVRPHWGQLNTLAPGEAHDRYPALKRWEAVRRQLDPDGVFAGPFSKRLSITPFGARSEPGAG